MHLRRRNQKRLDDLLETLYTDEEIPRAYLKAESLIWQFRANRDFSKQKKLTIMVTANMSSGKSTLINALVGKPLTKTAKEACTANLCYIFNKPFEDNRIHLHTSRLNLNATQGDLDNVNKEEVHYIASGFSALTLLQPRTCLIDTPGVDSAIKQNHGELTRSAILSCKYDRLIYVLNAEHIGNDSEKKHLMFVQEHVPSEKVLFVFNKLDSFKKADDSIVASIEGTRDFLRKVGFENPVLCPLSAYFSLLLKLKENNVRLNEDEQDEYDMYMKLFNKPEYDLSTLYDKSLVKAHSGDSELMNMCSLSGLYGLETILYGGRHIEESVYQV
jgi:GTP-binding protein EngB required for normal cell division